LLLGLGAALFVFGPSGRPARTDPGDQDYFGVEQLRARDAAAEFLHHLSLADPDAAYNGPTTANFRRNHTQLDLHDLIESRPAWAQKGSDLRVHWDYEPKSRHEIAVKAWLLGGGLLTLFVVLDGGYWKVDRYELR
jgi:hypothetical protein